MIILTLMSEGVQVVGLVVGLPHLGQLGGVVLQQGIDGVNPERATFLVILEREWLKCSQKAEFTS